MCDPTELIENTIAETDTDLSISIRIMTSMARRTVMTMMATMSMILIHVVVLGILVEKMKVIVTAMLNAMRVLCVEPITV